MAKARVQPRLRRIATTGRTRIEKPQPSIADRLHARGVRFETFAPESRLRALLKIALKDHLSYSNCNVVELRDFCRRHGLAIPSRALMEDLVAVLEVADERPSFGRFMDLPAELRLEVLEHAGEKHEVVETLWWLDNKDRLAKEA
ncbi:hypothetical protein LTR17_007719 [Elasticomyces elasticus]|nr:hypothetical protein LTR17_007719 [Elasticomyces elasticus]